MNTRNTMLLSVVGLLLFSAPALAAESDDLWARALFLTSSCTNTTVEQAEALFLKALRNSECKGPIFVSLGDYYSGPGPMREAVGAISASVQDDIRQDAEKEAEALVASNDKPSDAEVENVAETLSELANQSLRNHFGEMEDTITGHKSKALRCYLAAAAEDPKLSIALFRIVMSQQASEKLKRKALSNFKRCAPANALPHYLDAYESARREQFSAALSSLQKGNLKTLRVPRIPMPDDFRLAFPKTKLYQDAGVAGKPVSPSVLQAYARGNDSFVSMPLFGRFRSLARQLVKHGSTLAGEGRTNVATPYLESVAALGLRLVQNGVQDSLLPLTGFAVMNIAAKNLRGLYEAAKQDEKVKRLDDFAKARKIYASEFSAFLKSSSGLFDSETELLRNFRKIEDHQKEKEEKETVLRLLKKTGLDTFSFEK